MLSQSTFAQASKSALEIDKLNALNEIPIEKSFDVIDLETNKPFRVYHPGHKKHDPNPANYATLHKDDDVTPYVSVMFPPQAVINGTVDVLLYMDKDVPLNSGPYRDKTLPENPKAVKVSYYWVIKALNRDTIRQLNLLNEIVKSVGDPPSATCATLGFSTEAPPPQVPVIQEESIEEDPKILRTFSTPAQFFNYFKPSRLRRIAQARSDQIRTGVTQVLKDQLGSAEGCYQDLDSSTSRTLSLFENNTCDNNYLKKELIESWRMGLLNSSSHYNTSEPKECIPVDSSLEQCISKRLSQNQSFLNSYPVNSSQEGGFRVCSDDPRFGNGSSSSDVDQSKRLKPHCNSEGLTKLITRELQLASKCLDVDSKELFPLFNHESGFNFNLTARSPANPRYPWGGAGIGQLTGLAVADVNQWARDNQINYRSDSETCREAYNSVFKNGLTSMQSYCDRFSPAWDPQDSSKLLLPIGRRNLFYSIALYQNYRGKAERAISDCDEFEDLNLVNRKRAITALTRLSYSVGSFPATWTMSYCSEIIGDDKRPEGLSDEQWNSQKVDTLFSSKISDLLEKYNRLEIDPENERRRAENEIIRNENERLPVSLRKRTKPMVSYVNQEGYKFNEHISSKLRNLETDLNLGRDEEITCSDF